MATDRKPALPQRPVMRDDGLRGTPVPCALPAPAAPQAKIVPDTAEELRGGRRMKRRETADLLNLVHFREGSVYVRFDRRDGGGGLSLQARPLPGDGETLSCRWTSKGPAPGSLDAYACRDLLINDGRTRASVPAEAVGLDEGGIEVRLVQPGTRDSVRALERYSGTRGRSSGTCPCLGSTRTPG